MTDPIAADAAPARRAIPVPSPYAVMLDLNGADVLVVGGGAVAARKTSGLLAAGASVTAVAPHFVDDFPAVARVIRREYATDDIAGRRLVVTATGRRVVDAAVADDARALGTWVNSADDPPNCTFILPAVLRRGPVTIAVSSGGASPALAGWIRDQIAAVIGANVGRAAERLAAQRAELKATGTSTEDVDWAPLIAAALADEP